MSYFREKKALKAREKAIQHRELGTIKQQAVEKKVVNKYQDIVSNELVSLSIRVE